MNHPGMVYKAVVRGLLNHPEPLWNTLAEEGRCVEVFPLVCGPFKSQEPPTPPWPRVALVGSRVYVSGTLRRRVENYLETPASLQCTAEHY